MEEKKSSNVIQMPIPKWVKNPQAWLVLLKLRANRRAGVRPKRRKLED